MNPQTAARRLFSASLFALLFCLTSTCRADDLAFRRHVINAESEFLAAAVFDVNKDGKLDIVCGGFWYEGPSWKKHFLRNVETKGGRPDGYAHQLLDVNGDGWTDLITINWRSASLKWIEHPGPKLAMEQEWKAHVIDVPGASETGRLIDLLGDGTPVILPAGSNFAAWWELRKTPRSDGGFTPEWLRHELPRELIGHGLGSGDINGDGRMDVIGRNGWAEAPVDRRNGRWIWHADFDLEQASIPILVVDVDGDGLNDIVYTRGHDYGIYWLKQSRTPDKQIKWTKHAIDTSVAGCHAPLWADLDGDGRNELILGRRYLAHEGRDPGEYDPQAAYRYQYDPKTRTWRRWVISYNDGICFGVDPKVVDLTGSGRLDLVCGGRHGLYWLENLGPGSSVTKGLTKDSVRFPTYPDRLKLMVVKDDEGQEKPVKTPFDWGQRRAHILAAVQKVIGELPDSYQRVPLDMQVSSETATPGYVRKKITFGSDLNSRVAAYLLVPHKTRPGMPAMICLHDDTPLGKEEPAGLAGRATLAYAADLAERGYVCLVPDYPSMGETAYDFKKNPGNYASGTMKAVWDNIRGIDLLETVPNVSPKKIGIIGHGLGGQGALLTAAFDYRIAAVVSSCGFTSWPQYRGGNLAAWADPRYMPRLRDVYQDEPGKIPFDFAEVLGTLVPRSVYLSAPVGDEVSKVEGVKNAVAAAAAVYDLRKVAHCPPGLLSRGGPRFHVGRQDRCLQMVGPALQALNLLAMKQEGNRMRLLSNNNLPNARWVCLGAALLCAGVIVAAHSVFGQNKAGPQTAKGFVTPPAPALSPQEEMKTFKFASGYSVQLVAGEPLVHDPVAMTFDPNGRIWVCEMRGFMPDVDGKGEKDPVGTISILEDTDGDGIMDKQHGLSRQTGVAAGPVLDNRRAVGGREWPYLVMCREGRQVQREETAFQLRPRQPGARSERPGADAG